jgi:hypothetical protein
LIANDASSIILGIRELAADSDRWHKFSKRARLYYLDNHLYDNAMARFEAFFIELLCLDQRLEGR